MQRQRGELVPIGDALADLGGPKRTLDGEDRSEIMQGEGRVVFPLAQAKPSKTSKR